MTKEQALEKKLEQTKWQFPNHVVFKKNEKIYHFDPNSSNENNIFFQTGLLVYEEVDGNVALYDPEYFRVNFDDLVYNGSATEKIPQPINLKRYNYLFNRCQCESIDLSNWDFSEVVDMYYTFSVANKISINLGDADFSKCKNFHSCFLYCKRLEELVLGNYKVSQDADVKDMFCNCDKLIRKYGKTEEELADIFKSGKWNSLQPVEWMEVF